jgi:transposase
MTAAKKRKPFTPEFKRGAVALITEQGYSIAKAAQAVGTAENNVRRWKAELEAEACGERLNSDERRLWRRPIWMRKPRFMKLSCRLCTRRPCVKSTS